MTEQEIALANAKGLETRRRRWEQRNEKKRLAALAAEEAARAARRADEAFMKEAVRQAKKAAAIGDVPIGCVIVKEAVSFPEATTVGMQIKRFFPMQKLQP